MGVSEVVKEIMFIVGVLEFLKIKVSFPIIVQCDNVGAMYLANNNESRRTKHIDMKYHFVRDYVENGVVEIVFVRSIDNKADPFTKNVGEAVHMKLFDYMRDDLIEHGRVSEYLKNETMNMCLLPLECSNWSSDVRDMSEKDVK